MKKLLTIILCAFILTGCGNKSNKELTDIEQFKCQDSIETVFNVLGKTEMEENAHIGECYRYENLNLYGYNGKAIFRVRNDKDTISSFECYLTLNKKEFEDVLSQLSNKYGEYEKSEYTNQIAYVWEFSDSEATELGYNRISLSDYGDKKAVINFSDEWSTYKDEEYYKYLEEKNKPEVLSEKTYDIGNDSFSFTLEEKNNEYNFFIYCNVEDKSDAFAVYTALNSFMNSNDSETKKLVDKFGFSYGIYIGEDNTILVRTADSLSFMSGDKIVSADEYFSGDWFMNEFHESDYGTQVLDFLIDFMKNN